MSTSVIRLLPVALPVRFHNATFRVSCHATEDPAKVEQALRYVLGTDKVDVEEDEVEGAHGNPVLLFTATMNRTADVRDLLRRLAEEDPQGLLTLQRQADARFDDHLNFYLRFDKQEAFQERLRLAFDEDVVQVKAKVAAWPAKREAGLAELTAFLADLAAGKAK